jgi:hypothetical protein
LGTFDLHPGRLRPPEDDMSDDEQTVLQWTYPIYIIGAPEGNGFPVAEYEGYSCCLLYYHLEHAELYIQQATDPGERPYQAVSIESPQTFSGILSFLKRQEINHTIWNATFDHPAACKVQPIDGIIVSLSGRPPD